MRPPVIETHDLWKVYDSGRAVVEALRGVSVRIEDGEFVAIMGASGSGKSTFLNVLGCLDQPTRGAYRLAGEDVAHLSADELAVRRNRRIGFVFQSFQLLPRTSAVENVELPLFYGDTPAGQQRERARRMLATLGLKGREDALPNELSGGQQQRVAIARALINEPSLLLADEPTGNLDSKTSQEIMELLAHLNAEQHLTIVLVTHEPEVATFAHRVITFRDGRIVSDERSAPAPERIGP